MAASATSSEALIEGIRAQPSARVVGVVVALELFGGH